MKTLGRILQAMFRRRPQTTVSQRLWLEIVKPV